jgi:endonuclease/exonuclease/phosphatase (EEP) superfamily protein YafD
MTPMSLQNSEETRPKGAGLAKWIAARLTTLSYVYFTCLGVWVLLRFFFQDRWAWLFLVSSPAPYLFLPLPFILLLAIVLRRRVIWLGLAVSSLIWLALYGSLFLPIPSRAKANDQNLTVMTYNLLGHNKASETVVESLRVSGADLIGLSELNPEIATAIETELSGAYPYQALMPEPGVGGMGVISRFPLNATGETIRADLWVGQPQILEMSFEGRTIALLNFHAIPLGTTGGLSGLIFSVEKREEQAQAIADFAATRTGPVIIFGDLNAGDQNKAYQIIVAELDDAWRRAGRGLGNTFPGAASRFSSRPVVFGIPSPKWMIRIDYIFHSEQWQTRAAWIGPWDGLSDHRPVVATLSLAQ